MAPRAEGFTLIELSIVLVIIGLIVGGILVGQNLIAAAGLRAQISQIEKYNAATNTFRGKYGYLPGDIPNPVAGQFGFQTRGTIVGEGDGNGVIQGPGGLGIWTWGGEEAMFWVDLSAVALIDGSFTAANPTTAVSPAPTVSPSLYYPSAKVGINGYVYIWSGGWQGIASVTNPDGNNYFGVTAVTGFPNSLATANIPLMTPAQAYAIDKKMDDGFPQRGNVIAYVTSSGWASGGPYGTQNGVLYESLSGDKDPTTGGPVVAGDGVATTPTVNTCYDNNAVAGATENYSVSNASVNCSLSFRFQ